jgi:hypothetical protein
MSRHEMTKSQLKARIRVLESDLEFANRDRNDKRECLVRTEGVLRENAEVLTTITGRAIASDKHAVGGWFAWIVITTPTLIMLANEAKGVLEANLDAMRRFDAWTAGRR